MANKGRSGRSAPLQEVAAEKLRVVSAWLRDYITAIKNGHIHPFTSIERKTREATRNEPWGPTGTMLAELAEASHNSTDCEIIFAVIQLRLGYPPEKWRNVYKAVVLLDFLLLRGSEQSVQITQEELMYKLEDLETFAFTSPEGKDQGINVRHRAKAVKELMLDSSRLQSERQAFLRKRKAYQGYTRDQLASGKPFHDDQDIPSPTAHRSGLRRTLSDGSMQDSKHPPSGGGADLCVDVAAPKLRNAGETKGVTMEMNRKQLAELKELLDLPHNRYCADCVGGGGAARASWASINNGVFLCMRCAGVHRGLGTHVSKVRSCSLDTWLPEQVRFMAITGNLVANAYFEGRLDPELKPAYGSADLEPFIRRKYTVRAYAEGEWPPLGTVESAPEGAVPTTKSSHGGRDFLQATQPELASSQRAQPRLQGKRSTRQSPPASSKPLTRLISVPLPTGGQAPLSEEHTSASAALQAGGRLEADLMAFGSGEVPDLGAPEGQHDADLEELRPLSLLDEDAGFHPPVAAAGAGGRQAASSTAVDVLGFTDPPAFLRMSSRPGGSALLYPAVGATGPPPEWPQVPPRSHQMVTGQSSGAVPPTPGFYSGAVIGDPSEHAFQGESVEDWGATRLAGEEPKPSAKPQLPRLHVHASSIGGESELGSIASTTFLTPRFTALCGPGPTGNAPRTAPRPAPVSYMPPGMGSNGRPRQSAGGSALVQAAKQWAANARQGDKSVLDDLVLQAVADLPPPKLGGSIQDALAAGQASKTPSMRQQRTNLVQQLST